MTDLTVASVNVHVLNIVTEKEKQVEKTIDTEIE
jgi:uncharacterized alkaline shock family protein YloU